MSITQQLPAAATVLGMCEDATVSQCDWISQVSVQAEKQARHVFYQGHITASRAAGQHRSRKNPLVDAGTGCLSWLMHPHLHVTSVVGTQTRRVESKLGNFQLSGHCPSTVSPSKQS
jgi:hypothetical protein